MQKNSLGVKNKMQKTTITCLIIITVTAILLISFNYENLLVARFGFLSYLFSIATVIYLNNKINKKRAYN